MARVSGGDKADRALSDIARRIGGKGAVNVGFLEGAKYPNGVSVALVAALLNFGTSRAGPWPFFSNTVRDKSPDWGDELAKILVAVNYDVNRALALMGEHIKGQIQQAIRDTTSPGLAESTIERKGFDKPLVATGHMLNSVDYEVVR